MFWHNLGPGLITGAADDDPSGIATYSIAGAKFGLATLWVAIFTLPFIIITQRMAGRIGLVSGKGLAGNMKKHYSRWVLIIIALLILGANIINIGADISAMAAASDLLVPGISPVFMAILISGIITALLIFSSYREMVKYLKWVAIIMFSYVLAALLVEQNWGEVLYRAVVPKIIFNKDYLMLVMAMFGTTVSPYLFFWQASETVEEERLRKQDNPKLEIKNEISSMYKDVGYGMIFSNLITFFIIALNAATLFKGGVTNINTMGEIASALKPLAGPYSNFLFLVGILASGALAIPVLAGSAAYILAEVFGWRWGFENTFHRAKQFYLVIIIATFLGILIPILKLNPVDILFYTAVMYGAISPVLLLILIHMANNPKIMGKYTSRTHSNVIAYVLFLIMTAGIVFMIIL